MTWHFTPYSVPLIIGAAVLIISAFLVLRRSPTLANIYMAVVNILIAIFSGAYGMELVQTSLEGIYFWQKVGFLGGVASPVFLLLMIIAYNGSERWLTGVNHLILMALPAVSIGFAWTNQYHGLIWENPRMVQTGTLYVFDYDPGGWHWVAMIYTLTMIILSVAYLLFSFFRREGAYRKQVLLILVGISFPLLAYGFFWVSVAMGWGLPKISWHAYGLIITGVMMTVSLHNFQVFQIGPVAYNAIFRNIEDVIVVLDGHNRVIDVNPTAISIFKWQRPAVIGKNIVELLSSSELEALQPYLHVSDAQGEIVLGDYHLDLKITSFKYQMQKSVGRLMVLRDITQRAEAENAMRELAALEERAHMSRDLHDGLGQVLGYFNVQVAAVQTMLGKGQIAAAKTNLGQLSLAAREANADLRAHLLDLRTKTDEQSASEIPSRGSFLEALAIYLEQFQARHGVDIHFWPPMSLQASLLPPNAEEQAMRIIKEALNNVVKHAQASRVDVDCRVSDDQVQLTITDDGIGFHPPDMELETKNRSHYGLAIMRERAEGVGGQLEIHSVTGEGSRVIVSLPRILSGVVGDEMEEIKGLRILLADDHPLFLDGLKNLLMARGLTVIGTAQDGLEAVEKVRALRPDVAVLDLNMPGQNGLEATRIIKAEMPEVKVVILTIPESEDHLYEAIKSGASGYLFKDIEANQLCQLLVGLLHGEAAFSPGIAERMMVEFSQGEGRPGADQSAQQMKAVLTARQWEILQKVAEGLVYKEVAAELNITERTVKHHMGQIIERLNVANRAQAIAQLHKLRPD